jgi:hypothetical protein
MVELMTNEIERLSNKRWLLDGMSKSFCNRWGINSTRSSVEAIDHAPISAIFDGFVKGRFKSRVARERFIKSV